MRRITLVAAAICAVGVLLCGCGGKKNVAPQANIKNKDGMDQVEIETQIPEDNRPGILTSGKYPGDWEAIIFENSQGSLPMKYLEEYKETGVTVEVVFYLEKADYYLLGLAGNKNWNEKLYCIDNSFITGVVPKSEAYGDNDIPKYYVSMQEEDGFFSFAAWERWTYRKNFDCYSFSFNLSSDAIKYLYEKENDGLLFQTYGVNVTKIILGADPVDVSIK